MMEVKEVGQDSQILFKDNLYPDMIYVVKGQVDIDMVKHWGVTESHQDTIELIEGRYFDYLKKQKPKYREFTISTVKCAQPSIVVILPYRHYIKFANVLINLLNSYYLILGQPKRIKQDVQVNLELNSVAGIKVTSQEVTDSKSIRRKGKDFDSHKVLLEQVYKRGCILEAEETEAKYIYLILKGEAKMMKRPEGMYDKEGKLIKVKQLEFLKDPKQSKDEGLGVELGLMQGECLICEDAVIFGQTLSYSVVAKTDLLVYQMKAEDALMELPKECQNDLKILVLEKYRWFYERLSRIESHLRDEKENKKELECAQLIEKHTLHIYPNGSSKVREALKHKHMQLANNNENIYLTSLNRRMHKYSKPVTGYIDEKDIMRLEKVNKLVFKYSSSSGYNPPKMKLKSNEENQQQQQHSHSSKVFENSILSKNKHNELRGHHKKVIDLTENHVQMQLQKSQEQDRRPHTVQNRQRQSFAMMKSKMNSFRISMDNKRFHCLNDSLISSQAFLYDHNNETKRIQLASQYANNKSSRKIQSTRPSSQMTSMTACQQQQMSKHQWIFNNSVGFKDSSPSGPNQRGQTPSNIFSPQKQVNSYHHHQRYNTTSQHFVLNESSQRFHVGAQTPNQQSPQMNMQIDNEHYARAMKVQTGFHLKNSQFNLQEYEQLSDRKKRLQSASLLQSRWKGAKKQNDNKPIIQGIYKQQI